MVAVQAVSTQVISTARLIGRRRRSQNDRLIR